MDPFTLTAVGSAVALAVSSVLSKHLTADHPGRQLVGPLLLLNAALVVPFALSSTWVVTPRALVLHAAEIALLLVGSIAVWDLFDHGDAAATVTAQSLSPLPATLGVALLLPASFSPWQALASVIVVGAVVVGLSASFPRLGRGRTFATLVTVAVCGGMLTVTSRLLADVGVGIVATYLVRTLVAGAAGLLLNPPRDVPLRSVPRLTVRATAMTAHFLLTLAAVRRGSPAAVQTIVATAPLMVLTYDSLRRRRPPPLRLALSSAAAVGGIGILLLR